MRSWFLWRSDVTILSLCASLVVWICWYVCGHYVGYELLSWKFKVFECGGGGGDALSSDMATSRVGDESKSCTMGNKARA